MSFNIGLSGLNAANTALDVTGNNIANVATTGFKSSRAEFGDLYANSLFLGSTKNSAGSGVLVKDISQQFTQGTITSTGASLDLAINGNGFFITSNNGTTLYTRAGEFGTDDEGYIVDTSGNRLQGYAAKSDGTIIQGVLTDLQVDTSNLAPNATTKLTETLNLDSSDTVPTQTPFDASDTDTYNYSTSTDVYDSQGNAHTLSQYFVKNDTNDWTMYVTIDGVNPSDPTSTTPYSADITFNSDGSLNTMTSSDMTLSATGSLTFTNWVPAAKDSTGAMAANGASDSASGITLDMANITQYNSTSAVTAKSQDGYATGSLSSMSIDSEGNLFGTYSNGQSKVIGQLALANFANVQGLTPVGNTAWKESSASGVPVVGTAGSGTFGELEAGSLEESNVDLTEELVNLIKAQSNYQANAKTISTQSTIMQTIIQMT